MGRGFPRRSLQGAAGPRTPGRGGGRNTHPRIPKPCRGPLTGSQLVTMQDLKQGLGPSGSASARKLASNKYKLKVGVP